jgi:hypothetical protein
MTVDPRVDVPGTVVVRPTCSRPPAAPALPTTAER